MFAMVPEEGPGPTVCLQVHTFLDRLTGLVFLKSEFSLKAARSKAILFHGQLWSRRGQGVSHTWDVIECLSSWLHMFLWFCAHSNVDAGRSSWAQGKQRRICSMCRGRPPLLEREDRDSSPRDWLSPRASSRPFFFLREMGQFLLLSVDLPVAPEPQK